MIDNIYLMNFRRIEEADIDIRDGMTVLIGANGTGKSSIIESVLFTLYGKAKSGTKKESVRRSGASDEEPTFTSLDFVIHDKHYRCCRWYTKKMSLLGSLRQYTEEEYTKLLENKKKFPIDKTLGIELANSTTGVTNAVEELLGVSYEGFCASFIAKQKELDSLASLTLENRKKFFLDLLGYSHLDTVKPELSKELRDIKSAIDALSKQGFNEREIAKGIKENQQESKQLAKRIAAGEKILASSEKEQQKAIEECTKHERIAERVSEYSKEIVDADTEIKTLADNIAQAGIDIAAEEEISKGYDENSSIPQQLSDARKRLSDAQLYLTTQYEKERLEGSLNAKQKEIADNESECSKLSAKMQKEPNIDIAQTACDNARSARAAANQDVKMAAKSVSSMLELISSVETGQTAKCPTCGTEISNDKGKQHLEKELSQARADEADAKARFSASEKTLADAEAKLSETKVSLNAYQKTKTKIAQIEKTNELLRRNLGENQDQINVLAAKLLEMPNANLSTLEMQKLGNEVSELEKKSLRETEMKNAFYALKAHRQKKESDSESLKKLKNEVSEKKSFLKKHERVAEKFEVAKAEKEKIELDLKKYRNLLMTLKEEKGRRDASYEALVHDMEMAKKQVDSLSELSNRKETYMGAQQVIEFLRQNLPGRIAPKLAAEASQLIEIATDGRYHMIELDDSYEVYVYTESDIRPLAQMSGGETDVFLLCIRIAIAKLILSTTGIGKQTLILDEIFGALDENRKETTCAALHNIGEQLSKILCITHIEEIKDMADWTYLVEMDENEVSHVREVFNTFAEQYPENEN